MAALKLAKLKELIRRSYEAGYNGCMEMAEEYAEEIMAELQNDINAPKVPSGEWRIYTVEELKKKPVGTMFEHARLGQGWIDGRTDKEKCMTFQNGEHGYFMQNIEPWDEPMREIVKASA